LCIAGCIIAGILMITNAAEAQQGEWRVGGRLLYVSMGAETDPLLDTGSRVEFDSSWTAEFDATYMLGTAWGMEFMLTTAPHDVAAVGGALDGFDIGEVWMAESTVTINYHVQLWGKWKPYVGAGLGMAYLHSSNLTAGTEAIGVDDIRSDLLAGIAGQIGITHRYNRYWMFSFDIKYNAASGDIRFTDDDGSTTERVGTDVNSWLVGLGAAVRFH
jgi:outer membrane protein W